MTAEKRRVYYDLHLHSCLSPCADDDMTPNNIAGMGSLAGYELLALTDHNTCKNCPAFYSACNRYGITPVAGMELTTAEEIHLVCLFPSLERAMAADRALQAHRILIPNRTDIFGNQLVLDENDVVIGSDEYLLSNATGLGLADAVRFAKGYGAVAYPAHVDRESNGILAILGGFPNEVPFSAVEFHDQEKIAAYEAIYPSLAGAEKVICSDAHYLHEFPDAKRRLLLSGATPEEIRASLFRYLGGIGQTD